MTDYLLADLFLAFTGSEHPARPKAEKERSASDIRARLIAQRERLSRSSGKD